VTVIPVLAFSATTAPVSASLTSALSGLPTAAAVGVLCAAVILEIVLVPAVLLPGGTVTLLAGALIGSGRPALGVAIPMIVAVIGADQLAFFGGAAVVAWWRRRRPERAEREQEREKEREARRGRAATWLTAAMPSIAGAARMPYRSFAARMAIMRVPWLAAALSAGTLAAKSLAQIGHVAGIIGLAASALVVAGFFIARHRPAAIRAFVRTVAFKRRLFTTLM
jgi:membrane protein DedA with SNARE-associated domain